jgi:hypothetical protein
MKPNQIKSIKPNQSNQTTNNHNFFSLTAPSDCISAACYCNSSPTAQKTPLQFPKFFFFLLQTPQKEEHKQTTNFFSAFHIRERENDVRKFNLVARVQNRKRLEKIKKQKFCEQNTAKTKQLFSDHLLSPRFHKRNNFDIFDEQFSNCIFDEQFSNSINQSR